MNVFALAFWLAAPAAAQVEPPSSVRVAVASAAVTDLECHKRPFAWENTHNVARRYKGVGGQMVTEGWDPRPLAAGLIAGVAMAPIMVAAVPADLVAAPFRKACSFTVTLSGTLDEWAGQKRVNTPLVLEGASLLEPEVEGVARAKWDLFTSSAASDAKGAFSVTIPGRMGRTRELGLRWRVNGQPAGQMLLQKKGGRFILTEPDPGFGVGVADAEPLIIEPVKK